MNIYFYKMTVDDGGAPCCTFGRSPLWSLAICKPKIRSTAQKDDIVIGFAAKGMDPSAKFGVVHVAKLGTPVDGREYYGHRSMYSMRHDCIYEATGDDYRKRTNAQYHKDDHMDTDLGQPPRRKSARVLLSDDFRYFGALRFEPDWKEYPALKRRLNALQQGHRVYHAEKLRQELVALVEELFDQPLKRSRPYHTNSSCGEVDDNDHVGVCGGCPPAPRKRRHTRNSKARINRR